VGRHLAAQTVSRRNRGLAPGESRATGRVRVFARAPARYAMPDTRIPKGIRCRPVSRRPALRHQIFERRVRSCASEYRSTRLAPAAKKMTRPPVTPRGRRAAEIQCSTFVPVEIRPSDLSTPLDPGGTIAVDSRCDAELSRGRATFTVAGDNVLEFLHPQPLCPRAAGTPTGRSLFCSERPLRSVGGDCASSEENTETEPALSEVFRVAGNAPAAARACESAARVAGGRCAGLIHNGRRFQDPWRIPSATIGPWRSILG